MLWLSALVAGLELCYVCKPEQCPVRARQNSTHPHRASTIWTPVNNADSNAAELDVHLPAHKGRSARLVPTYSQAYLSRSPTSPAPFDPFPRTGSLPGAGLPCLLPVRRLPRCSRVQAPLLAAHTQPQRLPAHATDHRALSQQQPTAAGCHQCAAGCTSNQAFG